MIAAFPPGARRSTAQVYTRAASERTCRRWRGPAARRFSRHRSMPRPCRTPRICRSSRRSMPRDAVIGSDPWSSARDARRICGDSYRPACQSPV